MPRVEEKVDGISYYICGRREIIRVEARERALLWGGREDDCVGGWMSGKSGGKRRAADSLLEGNTYYRFWDETGGYPGSNHDKCIDIHRRAHTGALLLCARC